MPETTFDVAFQKACTLTGAYPTQGFGAPRRGRLRRMHCNSSALVNDRERIELAAFQYDMYRGNQQQFIEPHPGESDLEFENRSYLRTLNLTRVIVDLLSGLYRLPVERRLEGGSQEWQDLLQTTWSAESVDNLMVTVDRLARLQGTVAVQPYWNGQSLKFRTFPNHRFCVLSDPADHTRCLAVITLSSGSLWDERGNMRSSAFADIWTANEFARISGNKVVDRRQHGYGQPPFAFFRDRHPVDDFWVEGRGRSLCYDNAVLNGRLTDLAQVVALQGFGVMEVVNPDPSQELQLVTARTPCGLLRRPLCFRSSHSNDVRSRRNS